MIRVNLPEAPLERVQLPPSLMLLTVPLQLVPPPDSENRRLPSVPTLPRTENED